MGLLDRLKQVKEAYDAMPKGPKWGRIVGIGEKLGPFTWIELEIHYGRQPPFTASALTRVPRGVQPEIGHDVAILIGSPYEDTDPVYDIDWGRPPRYGRPDEASQGPSDTAHPVRQLTMAKQALREGRITEAEFERARAEFLAWAGRGDRQ